MCRKSKILSFLTMAILVIVLILALAPLSDFDQDGYLDSLVTEGFLLIPVLCSLVSLFSLWIKLPSACLAVPQSFSTLIVPPPIPTE
jgi:hypothetical protein